MSLKEINKAISPIVKDKIDSDIVLHLSPLSALKSKALNLNEVKKIKDIEMLLNGLIPKNHITMIYAPSNQGKTTATMGIVNRILRDKSQMECLYFDMDNGANTMKPHLIKILEDISNFHYLSYENVTKDKLFESLETMILSKEDLSKQILVFDSLQHFVSNDLSSPRSETEVKALFETFKALRSLGATILLISHTTKEKDNNGKETTFRGLNIIKDNLDNMFLLNRENNQSYLLKAEKSRHETIKPFIKLPYNHDKVLISELVGVEKNDYIILTKEETDKYFIQIVQNILFKDGETNQKDLIEKIYLSDDNELSKNEIKTKLRMYRGKHWLIIKGSNGNINIYKSINPITKEDIQKIKNVIINQNNQDNLEIEILDKSLINE